MKRVYYCNALEKTIKAFEHIFQECENLFTLKLKDYGPSWRILRPSSVTDQIMIKAQRIRQIEEEGINLVGDSIESEWIGIVNYGFIALIQLKYEIIENESNEEILGYYKELKKEVLDLMIKKNSDYGEAWREMRVSSYTDFILVKLKRIKQIEDNKGNTVISEGIDANIMDIINYSIFALIRLNHI